MTLYRIFTSNMGEFTDASRYTFVADFASKPDADDYAIFLRTSGKAAKKDIIIQETSGDIEPSSGSVVCVLAVTGEYLSVDEFFSTEGKLL